MTPCTTPSTTNEGPEARPYEPNAAMGRVAEPTLTPTASYLLIAHERDVAEKECVLNAFIAQLPVCGPLTRNDEERGHWLWADWAGAFEHMMEQLHVEEFL